LQELVPLLQLSKCSFLQIDTRWPSKHDASENDRLLPRGQSLRLLLKLLPQRDARQVNERGANVNNVPARSVLNRHRRTNYLHRRLRVQKKVSEALRVFL
jgi:hypothetical protein